MRHRGTIFSLVVILLFSALMIFGETHGHYVVPGGAHSKIQLTFARKHNAAARALWGPVDFSKLTATRTTHAFFAYDSYRIGNKIYWTKKPRFIPADEPIWTDGTYAILMRCGNLIALDPQVPTIDGHEPQDLYPPDRFYPEPEAPAIPYQTAIDLSTPIPNLTAPPTDPTLVPSVSYPPQYFTPAGSPPISTPEPSTGVLLIFGTVALLLLKVVFGILWIRRW